ncbi:helix-turn-helix domain-containing protein [Vibrio parahaemolyticus]|uniref:helix-turn-helix domain-containing protein n=2 Tax=Vibrio parahaemolyticus TaxID=670 RepID=UPI0018ACB219|nr:transcriptional regulator [Vibrio parahaemolyticus]
MISYKTKIEHQGIDHAINSRKQSRRTLRSLRQNYSLVGFTSNNPKQSNELEMLVSLVQEYEAEHTPIPLPDPVAAIIFRMEEQGLTSKDLAPIIGSQSLVESILNKTKSLTPTIIQRLHKSLNIPLDCLSQQYDLSN